MRERKSLAAALVVVLLVLVVSGADAPKPRSQPGRADPPHTCVFCDRPLEPEWYYCPWCGQPVTSEEVVRRVGSLGPKETVLAFFEAYRKQDRRTMAEVLDLESILSEWIGASLDQWQGLPGNLRDLMHRRAVRRMGRAISPVVLEILTSEEMLQTYKPPIDVTDDLLKFYDERVEGELAWLRPSRVVGRGGYAAHTFSLRKEAGHWVIIKMPFLVE